MQRGNDRDSHQIRPRIYKRYNEKRIRERSLERGTEERPAKKIAKEERPWFQKCLNPACRGIHPVRSCTKTSEDEKKRLLDEYREEKMKKMTVAGIKALRTREGVYKVTLPGDVIVPAIGD